MSDIFNMDVTKLASPIGLSIKQLINTERSILDEIKKLGTATNSASPEMREHVLELAGVADRRSSSKVRSHKDT